MTRKFNLLEEPWIPSIDVRGRQVMLSATDALARSGEIAAIHATKPQTTAAIHAFLIAFVASIFRPSDTGDIEQLYRDGRFVPERCRKYFEDWHDRFWLIDDAFPFYQTLGDESSLGGTNAASMLDYGRPYKDGSSTFYYAIGSEELSLSFDEAARLLVERQAFDLGGSTSNGSAKVSAIYNRAAIILQGRTLFETLVLNLPIVPRNDMPSWERRKPTGRGRVAITGPLQILTLQSRRFLLFSGSDEHVTRIHYAPGEHTDDDDVFLRHSALLLGWEYVEEKNGKTTVRWRPLRLSMGDSLWNEACRFVEDGGDKTIVPQAFRNARYLRQRRLLNQEHYVFTAYGIENNNKKMLFQQKVALALRQEYIDCDGDLRQAYATALRNASSCALDVRQALKKAINVARNNASKLAPAKMTAEAADIYMLGISSEFSALVIDAFPRDVVEIDGVWTVGEETLIRFERRALSIAHRAYCEALSAFATNPDLVNAYYAGLRSLRSYKRRYIESAKEEHGQEVAI